MEIKHYETGPYIRLGRVQLFLFHPEYRGKDWGFDADGVFAIRTPYFLLYPW